ERSAVVGARRADRAHLVALPDEEHRLAVGVTKEAAAVGHVREAHALLQVGSLELGRSTAHSLTSRSRERRPSRAGRQRARQKRSVSSARAPSNGGKTLHTPLTHLRPPRCWPTRSFRFEPSTKR